MSEKRLIINTIVINSQKEVIQKIIKEILLLFKIEINHDSIADYDRLEINNSFIEDSVLKVSTEVYLYRGNEHRRLFEENTAHHDENLHAAQNRLIKLNLFYLFTREFGKVIAPWGILHGVRPTKIVHRFIDEGMKKEDIIKRLMTDYAVCAQKAKLLTDVAYGQRAVIAPAKQRLISIYIGIPFCLSRCLYCSFPSNILPKDDKLELFMQALHREVASVKALIDSYALQVQNIYIGGGTPTSLPEKYFARLLTDVAVLHSDKVVEYTVEAGRPDSITEEKIRQMQAHHVDRISVNPQTMQEKTLQIVGRHHTPADIVNTFNDIRRLSTAKINMDVILGLPGETPTDVHDTMTTIIALAPDDITVHALAIKKGSRLKMELNSVALPDDETACQMAKEAEALLAAADYRPYYLYRQGYMSGQLENTGYCKDNNASIYNIQIMGERQTILGIGGAASTKIVSGISEPLHTLFNPKDLKTYLENVDKYIARRTVMMQEVYGK